MAAMDTAPTLRPARDDEAELLAQLVTASFADVAHRRGLTRDNCPSHPSFTDAAAIRRSFDRGSNFVLALVDGRACGCIGVRLPSNGCSALEKLAVLPSARRHGVGRALVMAAIELARHTGAARVEAGIIDGEAALQHWYERLGFHSARIEQFAHLPFAVRFLHTELTQQA